MTVPTHPVLSCAAPHIAQLNPYLPGKPISELERELGLHGIIKLASNENPLGPGLCARAAYIEAGSELGRYPDGGGFELRQAIAKHHGIDAGMITLGNGSNDVLDLIARSFLYPGQEAVAAQYTFAVYPIATQAVGAALRVAPARDFGHDLDAMLALVTEQTRVVWIANPNNPTGTWLTATALRDFIKQLPPSCVCVVDEAYAEYVSEPHYPNCIKWLAEFPNLIVTRTFAKVHGLAALRIGYGVSHPEVAELLNRVRQPFNVNAPAQAAAIGALCDTEHVERSIAHNDAEMLHVTTQLRRLGLEFIPSVGNFVTVNLGQPAAPVDHALLHAGIICRPIANYGLPNHLRITLGLRGENDRLLDALATVLRR
ncbi:histidinol-phosphate transaminase [Thiospirillum jenense]|uniref:Histidinol-phosphate aminotransferase n=1 Tax=Thiospirillum jenense TaxID=1653858 RepID=A0A839HCM7_9GAMM|nr:histidinol-phosphate transaminase [Thiospirillum jenense]MBB1126411.1 histidinol-phosphate transaminase [Thiospirillum jenense]